MFFMFQFFLSSRSILATISVGFPVSISCYFLNDFSGRAPLATGTNWAWCATTTSTSDFPNHQLFFSSCYHFEATELRYLWYSRKVGRTPWTWQCCCVQYCTWTSLICRDSSNTWVPVCVNGVVETVRKSIKKRKSYIQLCLLENNSMKLRESYFLRQSKRLA